MAHPIGNNTPPPVNQDNKQAEADSKKTSSPAVKMKTITVQPRTSPVPLSFLLRNIWTPSPTPESAAAPPAAEVAPTPKLVIDARTLSDAEIANLDKFFKG